MIKGFKLHVGSSELKDRLSGRKDYHDAKTAHYAKQAQLMLESGARETGHSNDPLGSLQQSRRSHQNKADLFAFMIDHLITDETYELDENDLIRLEIIDRGW